MLVAVPLFGQEIAPRFGFAERFLVAEIDRGSEQVLRENLVTTDFRGWVNRLGELRNLGVEVILCGGFNRAFLPLAEDLGIRVLAGLAGDARRMVGEFARRDSLPTIPGGGMACSDSGAPGNRARGPVRGKGIGVRRRRGMESEERSRTRGGEESWNNKRRGGDRQPR